MSATQRLLAAMNAHDADAFAACVAIDYDSAQPAHPARAFHGREQVRRNWTEVFAGVPDFRGDLLTFAAADGVEFAEWHWHGTHLDGSRFEMRGATIFGVVDDEVQWGRLYMEPVDRETTDIDEMVRETYRPPE